MIPDTDEDEALHDEDALPSTPEDAETEAGPSDDAEAVEAEVDVAALQAEAARAVELEDRLKRVEAEFVNETRRIRRKAEEDRRYAAEKVVVDLLPVLDALHSAREGLGEDAAADSMRSGLDLIEKQMAATLERHGVARIEAQGQAFDPARHQAIMMIENPACEPHTVCEVLRPGYELNGRVVRPAEVVVVKPPPAAPEETAPTEGAESEAPQGAGESD